MLFIRFATLASILQCANIQIICQDEEILKRHDFTQATESTVDVSMLPQVMQVKNFGKRSRTKYTHLLDQDTTVKTGGFGGIAGVNSVNGGSCFTCGGPHLKKGVLTSYCLPRSVINSRFIDCPQNTGPLTTRGSVGTGANSAPTGTRQRDPGRDTQSWRDRNDNPRDSGWGDSQRPKDGDRHSRPPVDDIYGPRDVRIQRRGDNDKRDNRGDRGSRRHSHSKSRSPYRGSQRDNNFSAKERRRSRSRELSAGYDYREKRRRID